MEETLAHLFWNCPFAQKCWDYVCPQRTSSLSVLEAFIDIKEKLNLPFFMEISILAAWGMCIVRNKKSYNEAPSFEKWKFIYLQELRLVSFRMKKKHTTTFHDWLLAQTQLAFLVFSLFYLCTSCTM
jgi:hypothetical protein